MIRHQLRRTPVRLLLQHTRIAGSSCRPPSVAISLQKRAIVAYIRDFLRSGRLLMPTNPLVESIQMQQTGGDGSGATEPSALERVQALPQFSLARPRHVTAAARLVEQTHQQSLDEIQRYLRDGNIGDDSQSTTSKMTAIPTAEQQLEELICLLNNAEESTYILQQITALLWTMSGNDEKDKWERAAQEASAVASVNRGDLDSRDSALTWMIYEKLSQLVEELDCSTERAKNLRRAANIFLANFEIRTGQRVFVRNDGAESSEAKTSRLETYQHLSKALQDVEQSLITTTQGFVKPQLLADMYNFIGLRNELAKSLGYRHFCEQVLSHRQASMNIIQKLHDDVAARIVPKIIEDMGVKKSQEERALEAYLSNTDKSAAEVEYRHKMNRYLSMKLENHVTLDGALQFVFRMARDLFGLSIVREDKNNVNAWNKDVLLYHIFDESGSRQYMGSFYIDPFAREGRLGREATFPIYPRGVNRQPVVCICLEAEAPAWDDDPTYLTWHDCEALFHEMGHVFQFIMSKPVQGTLLGPQSMALDISEFLPKFMELFLTEKSTLFTLIDLSKSTYPLSDEEIELAFKVQAHEKALKLAQLTYYSKLEIELFSGFDLKGPETIVALQERIGKELIPHDVPEADDATPILDILQENAKGRHVAWYRYLWCDVLGAAVYEKFKATYATNPTAVPALGMKLRRTVLEPGAHVDAAMILSEFGIDDDSAGLLCARYGLQ